MIICFALVRFWSAFMLGCCCSRGRGSGRGVVLAWSYWFFRYGVFGLSVVVYFFSISVLLVYKLRRTTVFFEERRSWYRKYCFFGFVGFIFDISVLIWIKSFVLRGFGEVRIFSEVYIYG